MANPRIEFVRLTEVPLSAVLALLNETRNARHMPLWGVFDEQSAAEWVRAKDEQWMLHGYGPCAVLVNGEFAGWGGFQREAEDVDFALVLAPAHWGRGADIAHAALQLGFGELGLEAVTIALPPSRNAAGVVARLGFEPDGEVTYANATFRRYRLTRERWHG